MMHVAAFGWEAQLPFETEVARLRRGDLDALAALINRYQNRLYRYLLRLVREPATAEDLFQQTWVRVAERIRQFDPRRNFDAWLFTLARNLAIDFLRRSAPESLDEPSFAEAGVSRVERLPSGRPGALDLLLERERSALLASCVARLPLNYREVIALRFEEEMKLEEIADVLGAPLSTVKTRLRRALEGLRREMVSSGREGEQA